MIETYLFRFRSWLIKKLARNDSILINVKCGGTVYVTGSNGIIHGCELHSVSVSAWEKSKS